MLGEKIRSQQKVGFGVSGEKGRSGGEEGREGVGRREEGGRMKEGKEV